ncbi:unnamed protein product [Durusdinium trenchii]|uniref:Calcineurin-like phosphoesterase domain-containing protein n=1 Tax=Durusdinium trenchii TaxID=1381693 RepID=A0ABP0LG67_9DINO
MAQLQKELPKALWLLHTDVMACIRSRWALVALIFASVASLILLFRQLAFPGLEHGHITAGVPKAGMSYFFSVGDFGVAACERGYKAGDLENSGGIGHRNCVASNQKLVADAMDKLAALLKPKFILSLGDNFYIRGVKDLDDSQLQESFVDVYSRGHLEELPWQVSLGDHDHRGNVSALLLWQHKQWKLPAPYYSFRFPVGKKHIEFVIVDSVGLEGGVLDQAPKGRRFEQDLTDEFAGPAAGQRQWQWLSERTAAYGESSDTLLQVVAGHRPIRSLAYRHGSPPSPPELVVAKRLLESLASGEKPVAYLHGHDHVMQHFREVDKPLYHFGNGAGGMGIHPLQECANCTEFKWGASAFGFAVHEVGDSSMVVHFMDAKTLQVSHSVEIPFGR